MPHAVVVLCGISVYNCCACILTFYYIILMVNCSRNYHLLLTSLSQRLSKDNLKSLVFSCGDILPPTVAEKVTTSTDLFRELKQRGQLGPTNYDYLREQLVLVGRNDLTPMLPDHLEVYVSQSSVQNEQFFGCVASPPAPSIPANLQRMKSCPHNLVHRMFLTYLSEQLSSEDAKKLAFLMSPHQCQDQLPSFELTMFLEKEGGVFSLSFISYLSSCLEAIGRADLAQLLNSMKAP